MEGDSLVFRPFEACRQYIAALTGNDFGDPKCLNLVDASNGSHKVFVGNWNIILVNNGFVRGSANVVIGNDNLVRGSRNILIGRNGVVHEASRDEQNWYYRTNYNEFVAQSGISQAITRFPQGRLTPEACEVVRRALQGLRLNQPHLRRSTRHQSVPYPPIQVELSPAYERLSYWIERAITGLAEEDDIREDSLRALCALHVKEVGEEEEEEETDPIEVPGIMGAIMMSLLSQGMLPHQPQFLVFRGVGPNPDPAPPPPSMLPDKIENEPDATEGENTCIMCCRRSIKTVAVPCGHMYCCVTCSHDPNMQQKCGICRKEFTQIIRTYVQTLQ